MKWRIHKKWKSLIWLATTWCLWLMRNDSIKTLSSVWFSARNEAKTCFDFPYWCNNPLACLQSGYHYFVVMGLSTPSTPINEFAYQKKKKSVHLLNSLLFHLPIDTPAAFKF